MHNHLAGIRSTHVVRGLLLGALLTLSSCTISPLGSTVVCSASGGAACGLSTVLGGSRGGLPVVPSFGFLFERYKAPLQINVGGVTIGSKTGRARVTHFRDPFITQLPLITFGEFDGDAAVAVAAQRAGITEVDLIEIERLSVLGVFIQLTVVVHGD